MRKFWTFSNLAKRNILLMSFNICIVEINWKLSSITLNPVNHIKEKNMLLEFDYPGYGHCVLGKFSYFNGKFQY